MDDGIGESRPAVGNNRWWGRWVRGRAGWNAGWLRGRTGHQGGRVRCRRCGREGSSRGICCWRIGYGASTTPDEKDAEEEANHDEQALVRRRMLLAIMLGWEHCVFLHDLLPIDAAQGAGRRPVICQSLPMSEQKVSALM